MDSSEGIWERRRGLSTDKPHQRKGAISNAHVGRAFELAAQAFFKSKRLRLDRSVKISVGIEYVTKEHSYDLGNTKRKVIVECKCHTWTESGNVPSAKLAVWNEAMYYFVVAPRGYRKIMFVLRDYSKRRKETLAEYYMRTHRHLIPTDVEFWEYDEKKKSARRLPARE
jgi:hypothetical protein